MLRPATAQSDTAFKPRVFGFLLGGFIRLLTKTLRVRVTDDSGLLSNPPLHGLIWMFWHNRMLIVPSLYSRYTRKFRKAAVLTSASRDGAMLASVMRRFGLEAVRGSSSRRGAQAMIECRRLLRKNYYIGITPDGPRGPLYQMQPGVIQLARLCAVPVVPITVEYEKAWRLKSWDRFFIPKPFSVVHVRFLPFIHVPDSEDAEAARQRLTELLTP
ncbi:MAG: hypothetical protein JWL81_3406, partial [Verrucomicrobiales bacterium]|nr:hypothetical protein [Verrucomicrobiales bacterium]